MSTDLLVDLDGVSHVETTRPGSPVGTLSALESALHPNAHSDQANAYALVGAGAKLFDVLDALGAAGLSPITMGSSSGQSVAGLISTGSHGGDFDLAPVADTLRAIVLVPASGRLVWIEADDQRRLTKSAAGVKAVLDVDEVVYSTARFEAAMVSVGVLGVVGAYVLQARQRYSLREDVIDDVWSNVSPAIAHQGAAFSQSQPWQSVAAGARHRYVELLVNPYRTSDDYSDGAARDRSAWCCAPKKRALARRGRGRTSILIVHAPWRPFVSGTFATTERRSIC